MLNLVLKSMKRQKKATLRIAAAAFIVAFLMGALTLFQDFMNAFIMQRNYLYYGNWVVASEEALSHPYLGASGSILKGAKVVDEEGKSLQGMRTGSIDESMYEFSKLQLYEGRAPENEEEAALTMYALDKLGLSYTLGQTVVYYTEDGEGNILGHQAILTGILQNYAKSWAVDGLPDVILTKERLLSESEDAGTLYFYELNPKFTGIDTEEFVAGLEGTNITYNNFTYENQIWGSSDDFTRVMAAVILVSVLAVAYLMSVYAEKRRQSYYRYRQLGASKRALFGIIITESALLTVLPSLIALILVYAASLLTAFILTRIIQIDFFYAFDGKAFLLQAGIVLLTLVFSTLAVLLKSGDSALLEKSRAVTPKMLERVRKKKKNNSRPETELLRRMRQMKPGAFFAAAGVFLLLSALLAKPVAELRAAYNVNESVKEYTDYYMAKQGQVEYPQGSGCTISVYDPDNGLDKETLEKIRNTRGVSEVEAYYEDTMHYFTWENYEDSELLLSRGARDVITGSIMEDTATIVMKNTGIVMENDAGIIREMADYFGDPLSEEDLKKYERGEIGILFINHESYDEEFNFTWVPEDTIASGDNVTVKSVAGGLKFTIPVVTVNLDIFPLKYHYYIPVSCSLLLNTENYETICRSDGGEPAANILKIGFGRNSSYAATDKYLSEYASLNGFLYENSAEDNRIYYRTAVVRRLAVYGGILLLLLCIMLILLKTFAEREAENAEGRLRLLKRLGIKKKALFFMVLKNEALRLTAIPAGLILGCIASAMLTARESLKMGGEVYSKILDNFTRNFGVITLGNFWDYLKTAAPVLLVIFPVMVLLSVRAYLSNVEEIKK